MLSVEAGDPGSSDPAPYPTSRSGRRIRLDPGADPPYAPLVAQREGVVVALDGCLFDRDRLRSRIQGASAVADDASLVLIGYEQLGDALFAQLRGSFVVAVWDSNDDRLMFVRDAGGSHPGFLPM